MPAISNSYVRPVYYPAGTSNGTQMFRRAPFDVVVIAGKPHIQPRSIGGSDVALNLLGQDNLENRENWRDHDLAGYETLQPIVLDGEHVMGDGSNTWMGMSAIGRL